MKIESRQIVSQTDIKKIIQLNESVKDENKRLLIASTLVALFPQADKSCVNADRIFFGTNKKVKRKWTCNDVW